MPKEFLSLWFWKLVTRILISNLYSCKTFFFFLPVLDYYYKDSESRVLASLSFC